MNIEDQVCSLELAKKLKELGVEQDSLWYWIEVSDDEMYSSRDFFTPRLAIHGKPVRQSQNGWSDICIMYADLLPPKGADMVQTEYAYLQPTVGKLVETYAAFTAEELARMLPNVIEYNAPHLPEMYNQFRINTTKFISIGKDCEPCNNFLINYKLGYAASIQIEEIILDTITAFENIYDPKLADAYAKMLIILVEKGIVTLVKED